MNAINRKIVLVICLLIFSGVFFQTVTSDLPLIFQKVLHGHDEASNSVVAANITREFFPPKVRTNPLIDEQRVWMEGPYWQHIPPMFVYVPYLFFQLDGQITVEVKRLSYAFLVWLTGIIFIWGIYLYSKKILSVLAATVAACIWIINPFTRALITGYAFGASDIMLAFCSVLAFLGLLWYLREEKSARQNYHWWKIVAIAVLVAMPIMAKNLLGAIPSAIFFILLLRDFGPMGKKMFAGSVVFVSALGLYYLPLYFASPETFHKEIVVAFTHLDNLEGWGRPWHYYLTEYLPSAYLFKYTWVYYAGVMLAIGLKVADLRFKFFHRKDQVLFNLSLGWFVWNLVAVSLVESKIANFIFQSFLFSLFAIIIAVFYLPFRPKGEIPYERDPSTRYAQSGWLNAFVGALLLLALIFTSYQTWGFRKALGSERGKQYVYDLEHEKFYQAAEQMQSEGIDEKNLLIIRVSDNDCWFRYPIMFLTGAESRTLLEMNFNQEYWTLIPNKYRAVYVIFGDKKLPNTMVEYQTVRFGEYNAFKFETNNINQVLSDVLDQHEDDILADIERIKDDKTSCQWLVPDPILNAD